MYTIHYECDGREHWVPVVFAEKQPAMENACELLRQGFRVLRVQGPGFSIGAAALHDYRRATSARVHGQTLLRKQRWDSAARAAGDRNGAHHGWAGNNDEALETAGADQMTRKQ
jgi:hypothetical protein